MIGRTEAYVEKVARLRGLKEEEKKLPFRIVRPRKRRCTELI